MPASFHIDSLIFTIQVALYILIPGLGWYTKPSAEFKLINVDEDGSFEAQAIGVSSDASSDLFALFLVPTSKGDQVPVVLGGA